jgi:DNA-binding NarL/FixJ family response regulator
MASPFRVVGETGDGLRVLRLVERLKPELLVLDAALPGLYGLEVARRVRERAPKTGVVMLSTSTSPWSAIGALRSGVRGYVLKQAEPVELTRALLAVSAGGSYLSAPLSRIPVGRWLKRAQADDGDPYDSLTPREREILQFVAEGHTSADIGRRLAISPRTVEAHRAAVMHKLRVTNQAALIHYALSRGLLPLPEPPAHVWARAMKT